MEDLRDQCVSKVPLFCIWAGTHKTNYSPGPPPGVCTNAGLLAYISVHQYHQWYIMPLGGH